LFIFTLTDIGPTKLRDYVFPPWADAFGWFIGTATLVPFVIGAAYTLYKGKVVCFVTEFLFKISNFILFSVFVLQTGWDLLKPTDKWVSQETNRHVNEIVLASAVPKNTTK
jgi:predicted Na+-dependent transporter